MPSPSVQELYFLKWEMVFLLIRMAFPFHLYGPVTAVGIGRERQKEIRATENSPLEERKKLVFLHFLFMSEAILILLPSNQTVSIECHICSFLQRDAPSALCYCCIIYLSCLISYMCVCMYIYNLQYIYYNIIYCILA